MGRHHTSTDTTVVELSIPAPRTSPESVPAPAPAAIPQPRGWRARRVARVEAAAAQDRAARIAHAQRRVRQVEMASRV